MPAFASFARTHIRDSEIFKSLASLLKNRKSGDASAEWSFDSLEQSKSTKRYPRTMFGGAKHPRPAAANKKQPEIGVVETELNDITEMGSTMGYYTSSQVNAAASSPVAYLESGITKTREVEQSSSPLLK
jgi:hypothetical protein